MGEGGDGESRPRDSELELGDEETEPKGTASRSGVDGADWARWW